MESTGMYWIPVYDVLEQHGIKPCLVNPRKMKNVPGKRTDFHECQWIQHVQHMHKAVTQMNVQIQHVISDITGLTGLTILEAIVAGERGSGRTRQAARVGSEREDLGYEQYGQRARYV
jgi:transposase